MLIELVGNSDKLALMERLTKSFDSLFFQNFFLEEFLDFSVDIIILKRMPDFRVELIGTVTASKFSVIVDGSVTVPVCLPEKFYGRRNKTLFGGKGLDNKRCWSIENRRIEMSYVMRLFVDVAQLCLRDKNSPTVSGCFISMN